MDDAEDDCDFLAARKDGVMTAEAKEDGGDDFVKKYTALSLTKPLYFSEEQNDEDGFHADEECPNKDLTREVKVEKHRGREFRALLHLVLKEVFLSGNMDSSKKYFCSYKDSSYKPVAVICSVVDVVLRGISQVYICDHPLCGLLIAIAVGLSSVELLLHCVLGVMACTASGFLLCRLPYAKISNGLLGYDGALVGCTVWTFLTDGQTTNDAFSGRYLVFVTILLATFAGLMHMSCANVLALAKLPPFTAAFNIVCLVMLVVCARDNINSVSLRTYAPVVIANDYTDMSFLFVVEATFRGVGQFIYADTTLGGVLVVAAVCMQGRRDALCLVLGSLTACLAARYLLQVPQDDIAAIRQGLYGYNSAGVCVVLGGGRFYRPTKGAIFLGCVGAVITVFVQLGLKSCFVVNDIQLPVMTFPFIVTAWIMMYSESGWVKVKVDGQRDEERENVAPVRTRKVRKGFADIVRQRSGDLKRMMIRVKPT